MQEYRIVVEMKSGATYATVYGAASRDEAFGYGAGRALVMFPQDAIKTVDVQEMGDNVVYLTPQGAEVAAAL